MGMFLVLFIVLLLGWVLGFIVFHVSSALIHLLLIVAVFTGFSFLTSKFWVHYDD